MKTLNDTILNNLKVVNNIQLSSNGNLRYNRNRDKYEYKDDNETIRELDTQLMSTLDESRDASNNCGCKCIYYEDILTISKEFENDTISFNLNIKGNGSIFRKALTSSLIDDEGIVFIRETIGAVDLQGDTERGRRIGDDKAALGNYNTILQGRNNGFEIRELTQPEYNVICMGEFCELNFGTNNNLILQSNGRSSFNNLSLSGSEGEFVQYNNLAGLINITLRLGNKAEYNNILADNVFLISKQNISNNIINSNIFNTSQSEGIPNISISYNNILCNNNNENNQGIKLFESYLNLFQYTPPGNDLDDGGVFSFMRYINVFQNNQKGIYKPIGNIVIPGQVFEEKINIYSLNIDTNNLGNNFSSHYIIERPLNQFINKSYENMINNNIQYAEYGTYIQNNNIFGRNKYNFVVFNNTLNGTTNNILIRNTNLINKNGGRLENGGDRDSKYGNILKDQTSRIEGYEYLNYFYGIENKIVNTEYCNIIHNKSSSIINSSYSTLYNGTDHVIVNSQLCDIHNGENNEIHDSECCSILNGQRNRILNRKGSVITSGTDITVDNDNELNVQNMNIYGGILYTKIDTVVLSDTNNVYSINKDGYETIIEFSRLSPIPNTTRIILPNTNEIKNNAEYIININGEYILLELESNTEISYRTISNTRINIAGQKYIRCVYLNPKWYIF